MASEYMRGAPKKILDEEEESVNKSTGRAMSYIKKQKSQNFDQIKKKPKEGGKQVEAMKKHIKEKKAQAKASMLADRAKKTKTEKNEIWEV